MGASFLIAVAIALPVGVYAAVRPYSAADHAVNFVCFAGISVPPFWLALLFIMLFAVTLGWLPPNAVPIAAAVSIWGRVRLLIRIGRASGREDVGQDVAISVVGGSI